MSHSFTAVQDGVSTFPSTETANDDDAMDETNDDFNDDSLIDHHTRDAASLTVRGTRVAYGPFEIEYKECLELAFNGDLPNLDNAYRFLLFHAYRPVRKSRKPAFGSGRFDLDEWNTVTKDPRYVSGLVAQKHKNQFVISRGHLSKVRSAILNVAVHLAPDWRQILSDDKRMKDVLFEAVKRKNRNKKLNYMEKGSTRVHSLEAEPLRRDVEGYMWDDMSNMGPRDMCAHLRHRATLNVTMTTLVRNDSWRICELSDMAFYQWKDPEEETPYSLLNFEVSSKTTRDSDRPETAACFRHKDPRYCPQGSIAFYLYLRFIISDEPNTWDLHKNESWFDTKMNVSIGDKQVSAVRFDEIPSKNTYYGKLKKAATFHGYDFKHWEHFGRYYGVAILELMRVIKQARAAHGGWEKKVYDNHYSTGIEVPALLGAAGFKPDVPGSHRNPRVSIMPPDEITALVWPWIDDWERKLAEHSHGHERVTAHRFLTAMRHLRIVLLQDAAWFCKRGRDQHGFFQMHGSLFVEPIFLQWAERYNDELLRLEHPNNDPNFQVLEKVSAAIAGSLTTLQGSHEITAGRIDHLSKVAEAAGAQILASSLQLNEMYRFQQYRALHQTQTAAFASSLPSFDPNRNYHWPAVNVQRTNINATITPSPTVNRETLSPEQTNTVVTNLESRLPDSTTDNATQSPSPPKTFPHCHNGCGEIMKDYLGQDGSIFAAHGGMKCLRNNDLWYRNLRPTKKENETAKSYVRRICYAGERLEILIQEDMSSCMGTYKESLEAICKLIDEKASSNSKNKRYISLAKIIECLKGMNICS